MNDDNPDVDALCDETEKCPADVHWPECKKIISDNGGPWIWDRELP